MRSNQLSINFDSLFIFRKKFSVCLFQMFSCSSHTSAPRIRLSSHCIQTIKRRLINRESSVIFSNRWFITNHNIVIRWELHLVGWPITKHRIVTDYRLLHLHFLLNIGKPTIVFIAYCWNQSLLSGLCIGCTVYIVSR